MRIKNNQSELNWTIGRNSHKFWSFILILIIQQYQKKVLNVLLFYLCEFGLSTFIKTKKKPRLVNLYHEMRVALLFLHPNAKEIIKDHQAQISH